MVDDEHWNRVVVPQVFLIISSKVSQRDGCALSSVNTFARRSLLSHAPLWKVLDLHGASRAGERLGAALALPQFDHVEEIILEFAQNVEDKHMHCLEGKKGIKSLNLNACQSITDSGLKIVAKHCPKLNSFSIYWNLRVTDVGVRTLVECCGELAILNLSGCKGITDHSCEAIIKHCTNIRILNLTRCIKLTDKGLCQIIDSCRDIEELYLYAVSSFTDESYVNLSKLQALRVLDLCGAQNLTDHGIAEGLANCKQLESLNLTWCVKVTDQGLKAISKNCFKLQLISLHGLLGLTDDGLECLSASCASSLTTIDVNGCANVKKRSRVDLQTLFPRLQCFKVHS